VVIVGPTASGKTALGIELAKKFNGEIICADSRTIYKGMDIGTAKPTLEEQRGVPHHLLSFLEPNQRYSAAQFKADALMLIDDIHARGKMPIIVGGTGLYIDSILFDYQFADTHSERDVQNPRHLKQPPVQKLEMRPNTLVLGIDPGKEVLTKRIEARVQIMMQSGFSKEVGRLISKYGTNNEAMSGIGYRTFVKYVKGEITEQEAVAEFIKGDKSLAKRQRTWFKRNKSIHWIQKQSESVELVTTLLSKNT
jgi:tRNA dimethylallyltransferase